jgi:hypothetical protein
VPAQVDGVHREAAAAPEGAAEAEVGEAAESRGMQQHERRSLAAEVVHRDGHAVARRDGGGGDVHGRRS